MASLSLRLATIWGFARFAARRREAARKREPLSYIMVDVDHFKHVNDSHGHITGDRVLQEIAAVLRTSCRETDLVGRTGGDEFGVVATATNLSDAVRLAQRLRAAIDALALPLEGNVAVKVTLSIGVAVLDPTWASPIDELMGNADLALYEAKRSGRNAVRIAKRTSSAA